MGQWSHGKLIGTDEMYCGRPGLKLLTFRETQVLHNNTAYLRSPYGS